MGVSRRARCCATGVLVVLSGLIPFTASAAGKRGDAFERGQHLFERVWKPRSEPEPAGDGLGPLFNERSCIACHFLGGIGGAGPRANNVQLLTVEAPRHRSQGAAVQQKLNHLHPAFAANSSIVLHRFGVDPFYEDFRDRLVKSNQHASRAGTTQVIRNHGVTLRITCRNTTPLFGLGLIDSISPAVIEEVAARQAREDAHIRGRFLGRFGWRGQTQELSSFIRGACAVELGLQVSSHLQAADPLPSADKPLPPGRLDLSDRDCDDLTAFVAGLPAPRRIAPTDPLQAAMLKNGESLFASVGCSTCHRPQLGNVQGIFSDLLVHDMGPALSDAAQAPTITPQPPMDDLGQPIVEPPIERSSYGGGGPIRTRKERNPPQLAVEQPNAWKTPPLWGVADSAPYLHDGRAATLADAILLHGGEAAYSVQCFCSLPPADQSRIIDFLLTLAAPDRTDLPRLVEATSQPTKGPDPTIGHKPKLAMQNKGKQ